MPRLFLLALVAVLGLAASAPSSAAAPRLPISLSTELTFIEEPDCTRADPCADFGSFTANDEASTILVCGAGDMGESYYFPARGPAFTIADRTLTCPDGSTLRLRVERVEFMDLTATTALIGETWKVTRGTGRFRGVHGEGVMHEVFDFGVTPGTLGGTMTGWLRSTRL